MVPTTSMLYYGDNLEMLQRHIPDDSIDLIYLDPPFNSNRSYNVLFRESTGAASEAQIEAFEDTWQWGPIAATAYDGVVTGPNQEVARVLKAMVEGLGHNQVTAYLSMMTPRLMELHRVLKQSGTLWLHCDPTSGHYLKMLLDGVFGAARFIDQVVWKRSWAHSDVSQGAQHFGRVYDILLMYSKAEKYSWNAQFLPYDQSYIDTFYKHVEDGTGRRYQLDNLTAAKPGGDTLYEWRGFKPYRGRYWAYSKDKMEQFEKDGRLVYPKKGGVPRYKRYLDEMPGVPLQNLWSDIPPIHSRSPERLGYQTQKPLALLERIVNVSTHPGDVVLDPFCGCGTAIHAAQKLGRRWIGIDITYLAIGLIRRRLQSAFPGLTVDEDGAPVDLSGARALADHDKYQFQWWALDRLGAQPVSGKKKGADAGIDGVIPILVGGTAEKPDYGRVIVSVKGGANVSVSMIRDLKGTLNEDDPIGVFLTLAEPTKPMKESAAKAGFYESGLWNKKFPRIQILTIDDVLSGAKPEIPWGESPFAAPPTEKEAAEQKTLLP